MTVLPDIDAVRKNLGRSLFGMVAGPDGPANRARIHDTPGPRWFDDDRPIRRVHADASMFVGGLRALLLQSLHPLAMAGVAEHSDYRGDPWGRLQRTSTFLAVTTFGPAVDAQRAVDRVRGIHQRVRGIAPDGRPYHAADPHLLEWVHIAEVDSFLSRISSMARNRSTRSGRDGYVADTARVAAALGVADPPRTQSELAERIAAFRPELSGTAVRAGRRQVSAADAPAADRRARALRAARGDSVAMLPAWARKPLLLPYFPPIEATARPDVGPCRGRRDSLGVDGLR